MHFTVSRIALRPSHTGQMTTDKTARNCHATETTTHPLTAALQRCSFCRAALTTTEWSLRRSRPEGSPQPSSNCPCGAMFVVKNYEKLRQKLRSLMMSPTRGPICSLDPEFLCKLSFFFMVPYFCLRQIYDFRGRRRVRVLCIFDKMCLEENIPVESIGSAHRDYDRDQEWREKSNDRSLERRHLLASSLYCDSTVPGFRKTEPHTDTGSKAEYWQQHCCERGLSRPK